MLISLHGGKKPPTVTSIVHPQSRSLENNVERLSHIILIYLWRSPKEKFDPCKTLQLFHDGD